MKLYTADELAKILKVNKQTIWRWGRENRLAQVRIGRTVRFKGVENGFDSTQGNRQEIG